MDKPIFVKTGFHCHVGRISTNAGHTVSSCNALCKATNGCVQFGIGLLSSYKNRCDLYSKDAKFDERFKFSVYKVNSNEWSEDKAVGLLSSKNEWVPAAPVVGE